jgi:hypothetical protein
MHPINQESEANFVISLKSGGRTLRHRKENSGVATTFLLVETSIGFQQVYQVLHGMCHFQTGH